MQKNCQKIEFFALSPHMAHFDYFLTKTNFRGVAKKFSIKNTPFYLFTDPKNLRKCQSYKVLKFFQILKNQQFSNFMVLDLVGLILTSLWLEIIFKGRAKNFQSKIHHFTFLQIPKISKNAKVTGF